MPDPAKVLIVDDHEVVRFGLRNLLATEPGLEVVAEAEGASAALDAIEERHPDLAIIDISLKEGSGLSLIRQIASQYPEVKMLVSSMHDEFVYAQRALEGGALGYINKREAMTKTLDAVRTVLSGKAYLSDALAARIATKGPTAVVTKQWGDISNLSARELEVLEEVGLGRSSREIAGQLCIGIKTVETHREKIKTKLNLANGNELIRLATVWLLEQR